MPEGSERLVPESLGSFGQFWRVPARVGVGSGGKVRKVPETGVVCCLATLTGATM